MTDNASSPAILIAEDNDINAAVLTHFLLPYGYSVKRVINGQQALEYTLAHPVNLIMMDINMPIMNGHTATKKIRANEQIKQPVIIAVTADATQKSKQACEEAGMDGFLTKPYSVAQLAALIDPHLRP